MAAHTGRRRHGLLLDLADAIRPHLPRHRRRCPDAPPSMGDALVRALCHDLRGSVAWLECTLGRLEDGGPDGEPPAQLLALAQDQAAHVASMLRTAEAAGGAPPPPTQRLLPGVVAAAAAASGLPPAQLTVRLQPPADAVAVGDARLQRILVNLLENAHRHGDGQPVQLSARCRPGWVELAVRQSGIPARRVVGHLCTADPPADLTGLGLWSVQRQARELGGIVLWHDDGAALTLLVRLPDR
jgi:K+-sensing histidine kinase KdpD